MNTYSIREDNLENFILDRILPILEKKKNKFDVSGAIVFALVGDLGAGKTTFSKTFLKKLGVKQHIQSPTFSIINSYDIANPSIKSGMADVEFTKVFHIDVYRIEEMSELEVLHFDQILSNSEHVVLIEWADKIKSSLPKDALWIYFEHDTLETRKIILDPRFFGDDVVENIDNI